MHTLDSLKSKSWGCRRFDCEWRAVPGGWRCYARRCLGVLPLDGAGAAIAGGPRFAGWQEGHGDEMRPVYRVRAWRRPNEDRAARPYVEPALWAHDVGRFSVVRLPDGSRAMWDYGARTPEAACQPLYAMRIKTGHMAFDVNASLRVSGKPWGEE